MRAEAASALRQGLTAIGTLAAIALGLAAQQLIARPDRATTGWGLFVVAAVLLAYVARAPGPADVAAAALPAPGLRVAWLLAALGTVGLTTLISTWNQWSLLALLLWLGAFAAASAATRGWQLSPPARAALPWSAAELITFCLIMVLAAAARMLWIGQVPRYYFGDESRVGMFLMNRYREGIPNFFTMGWNTWSVVGLSLQGLFAPLLGITTTALRLSSALMGTLAVAATYLLARELFDRRVALFAAVLLAVCRTAIDFSRLGICHSQVVFLEPLTFYFWWRGINTGRGLHYLWAGICMGLCLYTYNAGQSVPFLWMGWIALCAVVAPRLVRTHASAAGLTLAACVLTFFPYLFYATDHFTFGPNWGEFTIMARNRQAIGQMIDAWTREGWPAALTILQRQVWLTWLGFTVLPAGSYGLGYRGGGMLDNVTAPLFVLGLAMSVSRLRHGRDAFVAYWWLFTSVVGGVLTADPPAVVRLVGLLPALAILAALPLAWVARLFAGTRLVGRLGPVVAALLLLAAGWDNWRTYFVAMPAKRADDFSELVRYVQQQPADTAMRILGSEYFLRFNGEELFMLDFRGRDFRDVADAADLLPLRELPRGPLVIVLAPSQSTVVGALQRLYPDAVVADVADGEGRLIFRAVHLRPESIAARAGLQLGGVDAQGAPVAPRVADPFAAQGVPAAVAARPAWRGSIYWPTDKPARLVVRSSAAMSVRLADLAPVRVRADEPGLIPAELPRGWQPLAIDEEAAGPRQLSMTIEDAGGAHPVGRADLRPEGEPEGLQALYTRDGQRLLRAIDPLLDAFAVEDMFRPPNDLPVRTPFVAAWDGALTITSPGRYQFEALASGPYTVRLDGATLFEVKETNPDEPRSSRASRDLEPGAHRLHIEWDSRKRPSHTRRMFQLFWTPPGGRRELIPPAHLSPAAAAAAGPPTG
jgi:4-amino-4-deoxy-L-arabinose transferase-like glycosyltransferase